MLSLLKQNTMERLLMDVSHRLDPLVGHLVLFFLMNTGYLLGRPIKIEIISDGVSSPISGVPPPTLTLLNRLSPARNSLTTTSRPLTENMNLGLDPAIPT
jgi:hypothetical protein